MPRFSVQSLTALETCHPDLVRLFMAVIEHVNCKILCGHRTEAEQQAVYRAGKSRLQWPDSLHNSWLSLAVDVAPYPIKWRDRERFFYLAGFVMAFAARMKIDLRWGGDWDGDMTTRNNQLDDLVHFELTTGGTA